MKTILGFSGCSFFLGESHSQREGKDNPKPAAPRAFKKSLLAQQVLAMVISFRSRILRGGDKIKLGVQG
jgi:hypothetical protein